jgi:PAS domain S-box-containing protein
MVGGARDITERRGAQERIRFQANLLEAVGQAVIATDEGGRILYWNAAAEQLYGWANEEVIGRSIREIKPFGENAPDAHRILEILKSRQSWSGEFEVRRKDGSLFHASITDSPIFDEEGRFRGVIGISSDTTERRELDRRIRGAQKMEAVGRLAGGIAHDFNNVLTVILGRARLLLDDLPVDSPLREDIGQIISASQRAASLTSRLLAFSRSQVLQERIVDLSATATDMEGLLRPLIPTRVALHFVTPEAGTFVRVDPIQLQQVLLNLSINARDAIPGKGSLTFRVETREFTRRDAAAMPWEMAPGHYAVLSVEDTGTGIPPEILDRIFEPFFTTKPEGQGTGLGLSMVYGMMKQSRGFVTVESEVGKGSTFRLIFPSVAGAADESEGRGSRPPTGAAERARILVVEDDPGVGGIVTLVLERAGHVVLRAGNGREALELVEADPSAIDLIISDVVMPEMSGSELVQVLKKRGHPHPVILISGFSEEELSREARHDAAAFLRKPFSPEELTEILGKVLGK